MLIGGKCWEKTWKKFENLKSLYSFKVAQKVKTAAHEFANRYLKAHKNVVLDSSVFFVFSLFQMVHVCIFPSNFIHFIPCMPEATEWVEHLFQQRWEFQLDRTILDRIMQRHRVLSSKWLSHVLHLLFSLYAHHKCFGYSGHELMSQYG